MSRHHAKLSGPRWTAARKQALDAAGWRCSRCGRAGKLEVHHATPLDDGGEPYAPENLEVLCKPCHFDAHRRPVSDAEQVWRRMLAEVLDM